MYKSHFLNCILKPPEKTLHVGFHFTGTRSKATGIWTKNSGIRSKIPRNNNLFSISD